ncbi:MAG: rod shape-determining protein MreC [Rickettsiales bacterium]
MSRDRYSYSYGSSAAPKLWWQRVVTWVLVLVAVLLLVLARQPFTSGIRERLLATLTPALSLVSQPVHMFRGLVADKDAFFAAIDENKMLREENETLRHWQAVALALKAENESLRALSGYQPVENVKYVTARVVGQSARGYGATITINAGTSEGIAPYQPVVDSEGLIGRITTVSANAAQVLLLSDATSRVPVITGTTRQHALLSGTGEDLLRLTFLEGDARAMTLGEPVATTEEGALIPGGILVGKIFRRDAQGLLVKPPRPLASAEYVRVVVSK